MFADIYKSTYGSHIIVNDENANMIELKADKAFVAFCQNIQKLLGDDDFIIEDTIIESVEVIYYYIIEKIWQLPEYAWDAEFKGEPKRKLLIAFNKIFWDYAYEQFKENWNIEDSVATRWMDGYKSDVNALRKDGKFLV